ncbi:hypothetical protein KS4_08760 [Poriferisphaera corsica]|uniref:Uncharacterized protein n=1 Tax=Poriferisphaera corsica TaxID=2528020 RepID=A0A517YRK0_9BACT|nr:hypothetical protein KS4_08760 [Poriferisphaera corsica]
MINLILEYRIDCLATTDIARSNAYPLVARIFQASIRYRDQDRSSGVTRKNQPSVYPHRQHRR